MKVKINIEIEAEIEDKDEIQSIKEDKKGCIKASISNLKENLEEFFPCDTYSNDIRIDCDVIYIE